jgi:hypothetical protein
MLHNFGNKLQNNTNRVFNTLVSILVIAGSLLSGITALADTTETQNIDKSERNNPCEVFGNFSSTFSVTIPKTIELSDASRQGSYNIKVSGDIAGDESISVVPDSSVTLYSTNKAAKDADITQDKTVWKYGELSTVASGLVEAKNFEAGKWHGFFNFQVLIQ